MKEEEEEEEEEACNGGGKSGNEGHSSYPCCCCCAWDDLGVALRNRKRRGLFLGDFLPLLLLLLEEDGEFDAVDTSKGDDPDVGGVGGLFSLSLLFLEDK